jgi:hypothetical protein
MRARTSSAVCATGSPAPLRISQVSQSSAAAQSEDTLPASTIQGTSCSSVARVAISTTSPSAQGYTRGTLPVESCSMVPLRSMSRPMIACAIIACSPVQNTDA